MGRKVKIFGVPLDLGVDRLGVDMGPTAIRYAGLRHALNYNKIDFEDYGDLIIDQSVYDDSYSEKNAERQFRNFLKPCQHLLMKPLQKDLLLSY